MRDHFETRQPDSTAGADEFQAAFPPLDQFIECRARVDLVLELTKPIKSLVGGQARDQGTSDPANSRKTIGDKLKETTCRRDPNRRSQSPIGKQGEEQVNQLWPDGARRHTQPSDQRI
jgi:hypothetical protein